MATTLFHTGAFAVVVHRAAGFRRRDLAGLDTGSAVQKPAHENDNGSKNVR